MLLFFMKLLVTLAAALIIIGLCCLVLMRSCCHAVIRSCSNTAEDYATHAPSFLIISHEKVIQWKNVEHTFKNHHFAKFLLNG